MAQPHNGVLYQQAWQQFLSQTDTLPRSIEGFSLPDWQPNVSLDTSSAQTWRVLPPRIQYTPLDSQCYQRSFRWNLTVASTIQRDIPWTYIDTLDRPSLKRILRQSPQALSGDDPTQSGKWGIPLAWIAGGTGISLALFFIRSVIR